MQGGHKYATARINFTSRELAESRKQRKIEE